MRRDAAAARCGWSAGVLAAAAAPATSFFAITATWVGGLRFRNLVLYLDLDLDLGLDQDL